MFGSLQLLIAAAIAAAAASSSWWFTKDHYEGVIAKEKVQAQQLVDAADKKAANAATDWQAWAEVQPAKIVYRNRKAADVFKAEPVWSAASIPAGVRNTLIAAAAGAAASSPDSALPATGAASAADQSGSGPGLSGPAGFFRRLFSAPRGADQSR